MKKALSIVLGLGVAGSLLCGYAANRPAAARAASALPANIKNAAVSAAPQQSAKSGAKTPKYVFLFIGDGMSFPQFQSASDYLGALSDSDYMKAVPSLEDNGGAKLDGPKPLNFMNFDTIGSVVTYDSNSFAPDSASTATSIATGKKTYSGSINVDETATKKYKAITEKLRDQGVNIGVVSTVNLNHATPAAFYAHQPSRNSYYEIGQELVNSGFEYFAGGGLLKPTGSENNKEDLYKLAEKAGYTVVKTAADAKKVKSAPVIIIDENLADSSAMAYEIDRPDNYMSLADYVKKGIEVLDTGDKGFFLMTEGGKIDWASHANDAASVINDTMAMADAVQVAIDFAKKNPDETLILVTGDHETGGMTIGFAGTNYDTYLSLLKNQKISFAKFDSDYVANYKEKKTPFETVLKDIEKLFGLKANGAADDKMALTDYELGLLKTAYEKTVNGKATGMGEQEEYVAYGTYEPLTVTITHILNNKSGVSFTSYSHTGLPVAVFADGAGAELFDGYYDNTDIYNKMASLLNVK